MTRQLSPKSSADVLKQDAKRWLKSLRAGDAESQRRLLTAWPAAPALPSLRDVQHALAREYDFVDWRAMLAAVADLALDRQSHVERVEALLRHGWDGDVLLARRLSQRFPEVRVDSLFTAAACGEVDEVRRLLSRDASAARRVGGPLKWSALAYVAYGRLDDKHGVTIAHLLLDAGADPTFQFDDGWGNAFTLITGVIGQGEGGKSSHPQADALVDLFIARGADPFDTQALYNTSITGDDTAWTDRLWRHCARQGRDALWSQRDGKSLGGRLKVGTLNYLLGNAVSNNHLQRATWLLAHGAEATTRHAYSQRPVHSVARLAGFGEMVALLSRHGAQPETLSDDEAFVAAVTSGDEAEVRARVAADPQMLRRSHALHMAASRDMAPMVSLLLELGAPGDAVDHDGATALHRAAQFGAMSVIEVLLSAGAQVDVRDRKWQGTPMSWAGVLGQRQVTERLAPLTRDVRALARSGRVDRLAAVLHDEPALANHTLLGESEPTPLFCLPDDEDEAAAVVRVLRDAGADVTVRDVQGRSAETAARLRGLNEAADLLRTAVDG